VPIDPTKLATLLALADAGTRIAVCEYLRVDWDASHTNYYGAAAWHEVPPFNNVGQVIEPRLMPSSGRDPFHSIEINPDLRTETVKVKFEDIDKDITGKFQTYSSGVACEFFLYYPQVDLHVSLWSGQLQAPEIFAWKSVTATATNGHRSREMLLPSRRRPRECTAAVFAGQLPDADAVRSSLCSYDRHVGGSVGNYVSGTTPYTGCPKTLAACVARLGNGGLYFGGFNTDAAAMVTDNHYYLASSRGNASNLKEPVRVVFGLKNLRGLQLLLYRMERVANDPKNSRIRGIWEVGEGPVANIYNLSINNTPYIGDQHTNIRLGTRGQPRTAYTADVSNFSSTAHINYLYQFVDLTNPNEFDPSSMSASCVVQGFKEVCVYTDDSPVTKTLICSDNLVWCLLELYKNQKFGFGYAESRFNILKWMTAAAWTEDIVSHTFTWPEGETEISISRRTTFNAVLEGRQAGEQIEDICRSGAVSVPFEHEGTFTIRPFRVATAGELSAARVFRDFGDNRNIVWADGQPSIELSQVPDNKLTNEVEVRFEEAGNAGTERPITVDDPNQKLKAGRQLGPDYLLSVPKKFSGLGLSSLPEARRMAYRLLKYGEFDTGGTDNNLKAQFTVPFEYALGVIRYEIIKIDSDLLTGFTVGYGGLSESAQYFRVLSLKKGSRGICEITAGAYNHTSYSAFELPSSLPPDDLPARVSGAGTLSVNGIYIYVGQITDKPSYSFNNFTIAWDGTLWELFDTITGVVLYDSTDATDYPYQATWATAAGEPPAPDVRRGVILPPGGCPLTVGTATYNPTTGLLSTPIEPC
jgi:hypothetical protein